MIAVAIAIAIFLTALKVLDREGKLEITSGLAIGLVGVPALMVFVITMFTATLPEGVQAAIQYASYLLYLLVPACLLAYIRADRVKSYGDQSLSLKSVVLLSFGVLLCIVIAQATVIIGLSQI